jgi:hypothetical protein
MTPNSSASAGSIGTVRISLDCVGAFGDQTGRGVVGLGRTGLGRTWGLSLHGAYWVRLAGGA